MSIAPELVTAFPNLNDTQKAIASHSSGPLLVIAGPGSGKTFSLVLRTMNLLLQERALPKELIVCTFTEKAAYELCDRIAAAARKVGYKKDLRAGIERVLRDERRVGRTPKPMPNNWEGYDIESRQKDGKIRYIEVKSLSGEWDSRGVALTRPEFREATKRQDLYWLYVVERAISSNARVHRIQNPAGKANQFFYDDGWREVGESETVYGHSGGSAQGSNDGPDQNIGNRPPNLPMVRRKAWQKSR